MKQYKLEKFLSSLNVKPPRTNIKPPYWHILATVLKGTKVLEKPRSQASHWEIF